MPKTILLIVNPKAGKMKITRRLPKILKIFEACGCSVTAEFTGGPRDATRIAAQAGDGFDYVVCCGGDGTLNEVVTGLLKLRNPPAVGYIPCGTTNDLSKGLHISKCPMQAAQQIVNGRKQPYDTGFLNHDTPFSYVAAFGALTHISYATPQRDKNRYGYAAYLFRGIGALTQIRPYRLRLEYDGVTLEDEFVFGAVSNSTSVAGFLRLSRQNVVFDDGKMEMLFIKKPKNILSLCVTAFHLLTGRYDDRHILFAQTDRLTVCSEQKIPWTLDGEYGGEHTRADISVRQKDIAFIVDS